MVKNHWDSNLSNSTSFCSGEIEYQVSVRVCSIAFYKKHRWISIRGQRHTFHSALSLHSFSIYVRLSDHTMRPSETQNSRVACVASCARKYHNQNDHFHLLRHSVSLLWRSKMRNNKWLQALGVRIVYNGLYTLCCGLPLIIACDCSSDCR